MIALWAGVTAPVAHAAPNLKPLTACQTQSDLCITDPNRVYHAYFFNPAAGLCEYQITIYWGDKTSSKITLRDEVYIDHTYPGPGIYKYRAVSPPGTGVDCPAGEVKYTFEVPLNQTEAAVVKNAVQLLKRQVKIRKQAKNAESLSEQRQVVSREIELAKKAKAEVKNWRSEELPRKPSDPGTNKPYQLDDVHRSVKEIAGFDWCLGTPQCVRVGIYHIVKDYTPLAISPLGGAGY